MHTLPGRWLWSQPPPPPQVFIPPRQCLRFGLDTPKAPRELWAARWRGDWSCCCRRITQSALEGLFLFEKIFLLNPAAPYKEGPVLLHSPPLQLDQGLSGSGPDTAQLSTLPSQRPQSPSVYHFVLIPLPATSSNQVSLRAAQALFGRGGSCKLQESCCRLGRRGPGAAVPQSPHWSQGPFCPEAIPLPSVFPVSSILFGLLSSQTLGYCWLFALFLSRSGRCFTCAQGKWTLLPPISPPSFLSQ